MGNYLSHFAPEERFSSGVVSMPGSDKNLVLIMLEYICHCVVREYLALKDDNENLKSLPLFRALLYHIDKQHITVSKNLKPLLDLARMVVHCRLSFLCILSGEERRRNLVAMVVAIEELHEDFGGHKTALSNLVSHSKTFAFVVVMCNEGKDSALQMVEQFKVSSVRSIRSIIKSLNRNSVTVDQLATQYNYRGFVADLDETVTSIYSSEFSSSTVERVCRMVGMGKILATDPFHLMEPKISTSLATCTVGQVHWDGMSVAEKQANTHSDTQQEGYDPKPHKSRKQSEVVNGEQETTSSAVNGVGTTGGCLDIVEQGEVGPLSAGGLKDIEDDVPLNQTDKPTPQQSTRIKSPARDHTPSKKQAQKVHEQLQTPVGGTQCGGRINTRQFSDDSESPLSDVVDTKQITGKRAKQSTEPLDAYIRTVEKSTPKGAGRNFLDGDRTPSKKQAQETHKQLQIPARGTPRRGRINPRQFRDDSESPLSGGNKNTSDVDGGTKQTAGKRAKQSSMRIDSADDEDSTQQGSSSPAVTNAPSQPAVVTSPTNREITGTLTPGRKLPANRHLERSSESPSQGARGSVCRPNGRSSLRISSNRTSVRTVRQFVDDVQGSSCSLSEDEKQPPRTSPRKRKPVSRHTSSPKKSRVITIQDSDDSSSDFEERNLKAFVPESPQLTSPSKLRPVKKVVRGVTASGARTRVRWTLEEIRVLKEGVRAFGVGKWSSILKSFPFSSIRTSVDLKDKWRNLPKEEKDFVFDST